MKSRVSLLKKLKKLDLNHPDMEVLSYIMDILTDMDDYFDWLFDLDWDDTKRVWHFEDIYHFSLLTNDGPEPDQEDLEALDELCPDMPPCSKKYSKD